MSAIWKGDWQQKFSDIDMNSAHVQSIHNLQVTLNLLNTDYYFQIKLTEGTVDLPTKSGAPYKLRCCLIEYGKENKLRHFVANLHFDKQNFILGTYIVMENELK